MATPSTIHQEMLGAVADCDLKRFRSLLHAEYTYTGPDGKELSGADAGVAVPETFLAGFPDLQFEIKAVYTQGAVAIAEFVCRGTHKGELMGIAPTGRRVELSACNVMEVRDGKCYREREYYDATTLMVQLGLATSPGKTVPA